MYLDLYRKFYWKVIFGEKFYYSPASAPKECQWYIYIDGHALINRRYVLFFFFWTFLCELGPCPCRDPMSRPPPLFLKEVMYQSLLYTYISPWEARHRAARDAKTPIAQFGKSVFLVKRRKKIKIFKLFSDSNLSYVQ